jgi:membrane associated rhomboid family serine protease
LEKSRIRWRFTIVTDASTDPPAAPVWARDDAFPAAPAGYGWVDVKGRRFPCDSLESLTAQVRDDRHAAVFLVWTPDAPAMRLPEEIDAFAGALAVARDRWTRDDLEFASSRLRWLTWLLLGLSGWQFLVGMAAASRRFGVETLAERASFGVRSVLGSTTLGLLLLGFVIFGFIPWYQARKRRAELGHWTAESAAALLPVLRFESWLTLQAAPVTRVFLILMALVGVAQIVSPHSSPAAAGLVKLSYLQGEWWRLFTAPFLHGNLVHFLMNMAALVYLGKRLEVFARWPHLSLVFLFAATVGGEASVRFVTATSVGASGGLMGWLGFLIVFESLHGKLIPRSARRRLLAGVFLTALIGLLGYRFIDNAAHAGGLLAGMAYAAIVFPKSSSPNRPGTTLTDRLAGGAALGVLAAAAAYAILRIISG